jgi:hypothetical protein
MNRFWMDFISYPLSHRHFLFETTFRPTFHVLANPIFAHNHARATNVTASVDIYSGALLFLFVCMPQLSIPGRPVHSA